jgi:hypothetical protein
MKLPRLLVFFAHVEDIDWFTGGACFRDHRHGIARHDNCVGKREKTKVWVLFHPIPKK